MSIIDNVIRLPVVDVFFYPNFMHETRISSYLGGGLVALNFEGFLLNPFALIAITIVLGGYFGRVNLRGLKLGSSGSLFVGLALGYIVYSATYPIALISMILFTTIMTYLA